MNAPPSAYPSERRPSPEFPSVVTSSGRDLEHDGRAHPAAVDRLDLRAQPLQFTEGRRPLPHRCKMRRVRDESERRERQSRTISMAENKTKTTDASVDD